MQSRVTIPGFEGRDHCRGTCGVYQEVGDASPTTSEQVSAIQTHFGEQLASVRRRTEASLLQIQERPVLWQKDPLDS